MSTRGSSFSGTSGLLSQEATGGCASLISSRKLKVTLLSCEWGSTKGGLSTINRELAIQLAKNDNVDVSMYLPLCSEEDERAAARFKVCLLKAKKKPGYDPIEWLASIPKDHHMDVVIGHGIPLGRQIPTIKELHPDCKWIQVVHTDPEELAMFMDYAGPTVKGEKKHQAEVELCELADQVVAVGPKLTEAFACYLRSCGKDQDVINLTPGIFSEFANINQAAEGRETFRVLVFGRGDSEDFRVKGYDIAACAVAMLNSEEGSFKLVFVGAPDGEEDKVKERFLKEGILPSQLIVRSAKERKQLTKQFYEADLVMMPSRTEGFGLAALEALSAGLPVLVSGNSGIGKALKEVPTGSYCVVNSERPKKWAKAIRTICSKKREVRLKEAILLCQSYAETYQWEGQCSTLVEKMLEMIKETSKVPDQAVGAGNLAEQGPSSVSEAVSHPDVTTIEQDSVGDVVSSDRENGRQEMRYEPSEDQQFWRKYGESVIKLLIHAIPQSIEKEKKKAIEEMLTQMVQTYDKHNDHSSDDLKGLKSFTDNLIDTYEVLVVAVCKGSIVVILKCPTLKSLEQLWSDYLSGHLDKVAERYLVTDEIKKNLNLETTCLKTTIDEEHYLNCKEAFMELASTCLENPGKRPLHPSKTTTLERKRQNTDTPKKNPGRGPLHPSKTTTLERKRQNTDTPKTDTGTMSSLIGILVNVSESMKYNVSGDVNAKQGSWARSIFKVVDELIKHDVESSNQTFALALGCPFEPQVFDLLGTVRVATEEARDIEDLKARKKLREMIDEALAILKRNGARRVRTWAKMDVLLKVLDDDTAAAILYYLTRRPDFTKRFVFECLPRDCREIVVEASNLAAEVALSTMGWVPLVGRYMQGWASESSVREAIDKGKLLLTEIRRDMMVAVNKAAIMSVQSASDILHTSIGEKEITEKRVDELLEAVEPFIYGRTPLIKAMRHSVDLFSHSEYANHKKLLFVLSDGQPTDGTYPPVQELSDLGVSIVSCFITHDWLSDPRHLYSVLDESWELPAMYMFYMSSSITTQNIPRTLFVKKGWKIDIENNETRLFFQMNHPGVIKDVCDMAKNSVLSQDVLSDVLSSVDLDVYINQANDGFGAKKQHGGTCYANASAAVMHLAMKRIIGRDGGYPDFFDLRARLIAKYGEHGESPKKVLKEICPEYRLRCQTVDAIGAMKAICAKKPVVVTFHLTGAQWDQFEKFYEENPRGILTRSYLDSKHHSRSDAGGHAVVLTSYDANSLRLMNSWGDDWADDGFFRVQNSDVLGLEFVDVFWSLNDLSENEKKAYEQHGAEVAGKLLKSLKGLQVVKCKCPLCAVESKVVDFSGHLLKATCPNCRRTFNANKEGGDLALSLYLMSLIHDKKTSKKNAMIVQPD